MKGRIFTHGIYVYLLLPAQWLRRFRSKNAPEVAGQRLGRYWGVPRNYYRYVRIEPETDVDTEIENIQNEIENAKEYINSFNILPHRDMEVILDGTKEKTYKES